MANSERSQRRDRARRRTTLKALYGKHLSGKLLKRGTGSKEREVKNGNKTDRELEMEDGFHSAKTSGLPNFP